LKTLVKKYRLALLCSMIAGLLVLSFPRTNYNGHVPAWQLISSSSSVNAIENSTQTSNQTPIELSPDDVETYTPPPMLSDIKWDTTIAEIISAIALVFASFVIVRNRKRVAARLSKNWKKMATSGYLLVASFFFIWIPTFVKPYRVNRNVIRHWQFIWNLGDGSIDYGALVITQLAILAFLSSTVVLLSAFSERNDKS
jgi:hypothetical protein